MQPGQTSFESQHPEVIGNFRVIELIGEGNNGSVYLAERIEFSQRVAIKLLHSDFHSSPLEKQEQGLEQRLLASLDHSNIVRLIDQGVFLGLSDGRRTYLVLEHVDGLSIDEYCDRKRMSIDERVALLLKVVAAVSYAHRHLVIHSDLKPSNILVNSAGEPKLLDFSIGGFLDSPATSAASRYTPAFASPEQLRNEPATIASDVYALGLLATLLLAGISARTMMQAGHGDEAVPATLRLRQLENAVLKAIAETRSTTPAGLRTRLAGDLDAILLKALQPKADLRYASAEALNEDLRAYLARRPIQARHSNLAERTRKWIGRHWVIASLGTALVVTILFSAIGVIIQTAQAERQRRKAQATLHELVDLTGALEGKLYDSIHTLDHAERARNSLIANATQTVDRISSGRIEDSLLLLELAQQYEKLARLQLPLPPPGIEQGQIEQDQIKRNQVKRNQVKQEPSIPERITGKDALTDIQKGLVLLSRIPSTDKHQGDAQRTRAELMALQNSISQ